MGTCMTLSSAIPAIYIVKYVHLNHMDKAGCKVLESYLHFGGRSWTFHLKSSIESVFYKSERTQMSRSHFNVYYIQQWEVLVLGMVTV